MLLSACYSRGNKATEGKKEGFGTTYASILFFKNLRSPYYHSTINRDESILTFILKDQSEVKGRIILQPYLNIHQYEDRASITLKIAGDMPKSEDEYIEWRETNGDRGKIYFNRHDEEHTLAAIEIYDRLKDGADFVLHSGNEKAALLQNRDQRESFRITVADLLRLIEAY